jgi:hypothetical protein
VGTKFAWLRIRTSGGDFVNTVMNLQVPQKTSFLTYYFLKKDSALWSSLDCECIKRVHMNTYTEQTSDLTGTEAVEQIIKKRKNKLG